MRSKRNYRKIRINFHGYAALYKPTHPMAGNTSGYVLLHRMIAFDAGFLTDPAMEVHHINGDKLDNRFENLEILTKSEHAKLSTPRGSKRPRHGSKACSECPTLTASRYGLCQKHYKLEWRRGNIRQNPELVAGMGA